MTNQTIHANHANRGVDLDTGYTTEQIRQAVTDGSAVRWYRCHDDVDFEHEGAYDHTRCGYPYYLGTAHTIGVSTLADGRRDYDIATWQIVWAFGLGNLAYTGEETRIVQLRAAADAWPAMAAVDFPRLLALVSDSEISPIGFQRLLIEAGYQDWTPDEIYGPETTTADALATAPTDPREISF